MDQNELLRIAIGVVTELGMVGVLLLVLKKLSDMYDVLITLIISLVDKQTADDEQRDG